MQLIHTLSLTGLALVGSTSALFYYREKPFKDVAVASAFLATVSAMKLIEHEHGEAMKAMSKNLWSYLSTLVKR